MAASSQHHTSLTRVFVDVYLSSRLSDLVNQGINSPCELCGKRGEASAHEQDVASGMAVNGLGPLVPVNMHNAGTVWVHHQCGLWSSEVFIDETNSQLVSYTHPPAVDADVTNDLLCM